MIDFALSDEQVMIQHLAADFSRKEIIPVAAQFDETATMPWPIIHAAAKIGLWNMNVPEVYGGQGIDHVTQCLVAEELAYGCLGIFGAFGGNSLALTPLLNFGTDEQKDRYLRWFCSEVRLAAFALTESDAGSDVRAVKTRAVREGDYYTLTGVKCFITHGGIADLYTVFAVVDEKPQSLSAFLVPGNSPGIYTGKKEQKMGDRASHVAEVILDGVRVPVQNRLLDEGDGMRIAMKTLDISRPLIGAAAVGLARRAMEEAAHYAQVRVQFAQPISSFEMIQAMLADMAMAVESARMVVLKAAWLVDQGKADPMVSAMAKCLASDSAMKVALDAVQILGGYGYMKDYPVEKLLRDAKITQIYEGTNQIQRLVIASQLLARLQ